MVMASRAIRLLPGLFASALISALGGCGAPAAPRVDAAVIAAVEAASQSAAVSPYAEKLYADHCAACHNGGMAEAPTRAALEAKDPAAILAAMTSGVMREQATMISPSEKDALAAYLGRAVADRARRTVAVNACAAPLEFSAPAQWGRWGGDKRNTRFQSAASAGLDAQAAPALKLKWAFGFPNAARARSQPAATAEAIFLGSQDGAFYALNPESGCVHWRYFAGAEVRNAAVIEEDRAGVPHTLYFADLDATVYAVDAATGAERWKVSVRDHPVGTITGSLALHDGRLFVPMSSTEIVSAHNPQYECCTFRGGVVALSTADGRRLWRYYTTPEPEKTRVNDQGVQNFGPSGAPVWTTPTIDEKRGVVYVGTGENYSSPATAMSDAIVALDIATGAVRWVRQTVAGDAWNGACGRTEANCPQEDGPDFDFGAPPMLLRLTDGEEIIVAGQKSGMVFGLDPDDDGRILWEKRAGMGGYNGGVHWGMASDGATVYVGVADTPGHHATVGSPRPGVHAYAAATGAERWSRIEPRPCLSDARECFPAISAPVTATPDLVVAGGLDGVLRIYRAADGEPLWSVDTRRDFQSVNGVAARGGSIDAAGPVIANGRIIVNSGYDKFGNIPGNALLVFEADGKAQP
jgi:polyvinyl alcohol dehydrogenase (cytochrome)